MAVTGFVFVFLAGSLGPVDQRYLQLAAEDNIAELKLVRMVREKTKNPAVRNACEVMLKDHTIQYGEVKTLAKSLGVSLPTEPNPTHQALFKHLSGKSGKELDKSFTAAQLQDHINDVNEAQDETEVGDSLKLKNFAKHAVRTFAKHEHIWREVAKEVGVEPTFGRPSAEQILAGKKISD